MKKYSLIAALVLMILGSSSTVALSTAEAQAVSSSEDLAVDEEGNLVGPRPPRYEVEEDGTLIIDGDVLLVDYCRLLVEDPDQINPVNEEYAEACAAAGFSSPVSESTVLPETGGIDVAVLAVAASVLVGSILALAAVR